MAKLKILLVSLACYLVAATVQVQSATFKQTIKPVDGTVMITETTNLLTVAIANMTSTNTVVDDTGATNTVVSLNFTNVTVTATFWGTNTVYLLDTGIKPDVKANDATYSGNLIAPLTKVALKLPVIFTIKGTDLTATNEQGEIVETPIKVTATMTYNIYPRPINDKFSNALKIVPEGGLFTTYTAFDSANTLNITNNYASTETGEPSHAGNSSATATVWWKWSSPVATNVLIDLAGSSFKPIIAVYSGTALASLTPVASSSTTTPPAYVQFNAEAGKTYQIAVASADTNLTSQGTIRLRLARGAQPDTTGPTTRIISPKTGALFTSEQVSFNGVAAEPSGAQSGLKQVYLQINSGSPTPVSTSGSWSASLTLPPGTNTISAFATDYVGNYGASNTITVVFMNPTNDMFASSIELKDTSGEITAINGRATKEAGEPAHGGNEGGHSIWYRYVAPDNGLLTISTTNSTFDTLVSVYTGDTVSNLVSVAANDDAIPGSMYSYLQCYVTANNVYYIAVDGFGGASGNLDLEYSFVPKAPASFYTLAVTATDGGTVNPPNGYYSQGSEITLKASALPNYVFYRWEGDVSSTNNPITVTMSGDKTVTARFRYLSATEDFETGAFKAANKWSFGGNLPWVVQSSVAEDKYSARSGAIGKNQTSQMTLVAYSQAGQASFDVRVSSEGPYDVVKFYLNGTLLKQWAGEIGWTTYAFDVPKGTNTLAWVYEKDDSFDEGLDAAFVDNISLPQGSLAATIDAIRTWDSSVLKLTITGRYNQSYLIQASSDLKNWTTIATKVTAANGVLTFTDSTAPQYGNRYYRAVGN